MSEPPIACTLSAAEFRERRADLLPGLLARCCPFLRFVVTAEPNGGPIYLEVTGPPGTRELLDQLQS